MASEPLADVELKSAAYKRLFCSGLDVIDAATDCINHLAASCKLKPMAFDSIVTGNIIRFTSGDDWMTVAFEPADIVIPDSDEIAAPGLQLCVLDGTYSGVFLDDIPLYWLYTQQGVVGHSYEHFVNELTMQKIPLSSCFGSD